MEHLSYTIEQVLKEAKQQWRELRSIHGYCSTIIEAFAEEDYNEVLLNLGYIKAVVTDRVRRGGEKDVDNRDESPREA